MILVKRVLPSTFLGLRAGIGGARGEGRRWCLYARMRNSTYVLETCCLGVHAKTGQVLKMITDQENVSKILSVLSHRIRREILTTLSEKGESSFTDLMNKVDIDTGKLSFHMRSLQPFMEQTHNGKYKLSRSGESALRVIKDVESWADITDINGKTTHLSLATFKKRTYAFCIDLLITVLITSTLILPELFVEGKIVTMEFLFVTLGLFWAYTTLLEGFNGQTIGKRIAGIKVVRTDGKKMFYDHSAIRNFGKAFLLPFDLIVGYRIKDPKFTRYFDRFAGTAVTNVRLKTIN